MLASISSEAFNSYKKWIRENRVPFALFPSLAKGKHYGLYEMQ